MIRRQIINPWKDSTLSLYSKEFVKKFAAKILASVFKNSRGIIFIDNPDKEKTLTEEEYHSALLAQLKKNAE